MYKTDIACKITGFLSNPLPYYSKKSLKDEKQLPINQFDRMGSEAI